MYSIAVKAYHDSKSKNYFGFIWVYKYRNVNKDVSTNPGLHKRTFTELFDINRFNTH